MRGPVEGTRRRAAWDSAELAGRQTAGRRPSRWAGGQAAEEKHKSQDE